jgi:O-acetyl-ADP-ribose deacetylase (regulator of RNase III)
VAFPLVSAGIYGWPFEDAVLAAADTLTTTTTSVEVGRIVTFGASTYERVIKITGP